MSKPPGDDPIAAEIQAEIADHLATAAEKLQSQGLATDEARQKSQAKFGDPAAIGRRCYWIKQGDALMFRTAVIALLAILCLALGFATFSSYRSQHQMAEQMAALAEQLKALADQKIATPVPNVEQPPQEISGQVYIKTADQPAANKELMIVNAKDGNIVRRVMTDGAGQYRSGPLPDGDYCLVTAFKSPPARVFPFYRYLQTAPIFVYPGLPAPGHDLNIAPQSGRLAIELSRELPSVNVDGKYTIQARLMVEVSTSQRRDQLWTSSMPMPPTWPLHVMNASASERGTPWASFFELLSNEDLEKQHETTHFGDGYGLLPAGPANVVAAVIADVIPLDYQRPELRLIDATSQSFQEVVRRRVFQDHDWQNVLPSVGSIISGPPPTTAAENAIENDDFFWMTKGLGKIWLGKLQAVESEPKPQIVPRSWLRTNSREWECHVPISPGSVTRLRIEVPRNLEQAINELVESTTEADEFAKYTLGGNAATPLEMQQLLNSGAHPFLRKVKIAVAANEPLPSTE